MNHRLEMYLKRRIKRTEVQIESYKDYESTTYTFHGGWSKGYHEGVLTTLQDILDMIEDEYSIEDEIRHNRAFLEYRIKGRYDEP